MVRSTTPTPCSRGATAVAVWMPSGNASTTRGRNPTFKAAITTARSTAAAMDHGMATATDQTMATGMAPATGTATPDMVTKAAAGMAPATGDRRVLGRTTVAPVVTEMAAQAA